MTNESVDSYREYIRAKVSKVLILGDPDERDLKDVFVELSIVDQRPPPFNREFLGMWDAGLRTRFNPFADADKDLPSEMIGREEQKTKRNVKPGELLKPKSKAIVTGAPGCGKSTLLKFLAFEATMCIDMPT